MTWQPIETAPKDRQIIGWWPQLIPNHPSRGVAGVCRAHKWYWVIEVFGEMIECAAPTHWMPLPPMPLPPPPEAKP